MKKTFICTAAGLALLAASCKETVAPVSTEDIVAEDSTYVDVIATPQNKRILIEELSGVICPNCPAGATQLEQMDASNPGLLSIITIHTGSLTDPIAGKSKQDLRTADGDLIRMNVFGEQGNKPTASFDRLPIGNNGNKYFVDGYPLWTAKLADIKNSTTATPVNITVTSAYSEPQAQYNIEVTLKYTAAVTDRQALHVFLTENSIKDVQEYSSSNYDTAYVFNHVFRKALTPAISGRLILDSLATKEPGRVYVYRTALKIDANDAFQRFWNPANMKVTAFVTTTATNDKKVVHVQETKLR